MEKVIIEWSEPLNLFKPGTYNTEGKFIEHLRKAIYKNKNPILDQTGIFMFLSGEIKPKERLSIVIIEGTADHSIKEHITRKKGHIREFKCLYKNYKNEELYLKVGKLKNIEETPDSIKTTVCALIEYTSPSCVQPCKNQKVDLIIQNTGNYTPLKEIYPQEEE
ncbi:MAG: hypothetical protein GXO22_05400 [Aquificae bacterium]|nr:hypothetical protein [Aquificota bacterium]